MAAASATVVAFGVLTPSAEDGSAPASVSPQCFGKIEEIDEDGGFVIEFDLHGKQWMESGALSRLAKVILNSERASMYSKTLPQQVAVHKTGRVCSESFGPFSTALAAAWSLAPT